MVLEVICYPITEVISEGIMVKYSPRHWEKERPNASYLAVFAISLPSLCHLFAISLPPGSLLATSTTKGLCPLSINCVIQMTLGFT